MRRILAGLAVVGMLMVASPAQAATDSVVFSHLTRFESAHVVVTSTAAGDVTAHVTWTPRKGASYWLYIDGPYPTPRCTVTNDQGIADAAGVLLTDQPLGDWTCTITAALAGTYDAGFKPVSGTWVDGTLTLTTP